MLSMAALQRSEHKMTDYFRTNRNACNFGGDGLRGLHLE